MNHFLFGTTYPSSAAGPEADFTTHTVDLIFTETEIVHRVNISITDDLFLEDDETLQSSISLVTDEDGIVLEPDVATITILNDDGKGRLAL